MDDVTSRNIDAAPPAGIGERRSVPGPKSQAIFAREAEAMAPGLQSIALYSQIVVDHAKGCTIVDVDGNEYLDLIAGIAELTISAATSQAAFEACPAAAALPVSGNRTPTFTGSAARAGVAPVAKDVAAAPAPMRTVRRSMPRLVI